MVLFSFTEYSSLVALCGVLLGLLWQIYQWYFSKHQKEEEKKEEEKDENLEEARKIREETRQLLEKSREDSKKYEDKLQAMSEKYDKLFYNKLQLEIEITVLNYEHQLLFDKLPTDITEDIRERVSKFRDSLNNRIVIKNTDEIIKGS